MVMIGAAAVAVVVILFLVVGNGEKAEAGGSGAAAPAAAPVRAPASQPSLEGGRAIAGKTPDRPAPALTAETLGRLDELLAEAKEHYNDGVRKRRAGDNMGARAAQAEAKTLLDDWENLIRPQLNWQEEAQLEGWAQPAEYDHLERRYPAFSSLQKMVRMGGGK